MKLLDLTLADQSLAADIQGSLSGVINCTKFLHVDDLADDCFFLMKNYDQDEFVNVGVGDDISIKDLAILIKNTVGYEGDLTWNTSMPNGTPRKLMNVNKLSALGWKAKIGLEEGMRETVAQYHELLIV